MVHGAAIGKTPIGFSIRAALWTPQRSRVRVAAWKSI